MKYVSRITTSLTLSDGEEFILNLGNEYDLPEDNAHIQSLEAQGLLFRVPGQVAAPVETKPAKAAPAKGAAAAKAPKTAKAPKAEKTGEKSTGKKAAAPAKAAAAPNANNSNPS